MKLKSFAATLGVALSLTAAHLYLAHADSVTEAPSAQAAISALKQAGAARTGETAMFTPGNHTLYGLEYLENKQYVESTWRFRDALGVDPDYALAHYLLGQAYINLKQFDEARKSLEKAAQLSPQYQAEVNTQLTKLNEAKQAAAKPKPTQKSSAKAPAKPASANPKKAGPAKAPPKAPRYFKSPPMGKYLCDHIRWDVGERRIKFDYKGYFLLKSNGTYRWIDDGPIGRYQFNAKTREVKFLSGHLAQPGLVAKFGTDADGQTPEIIITFHTAASRAKKVQPIEWQCTLQDK